MNLSLADLLILQKALDYYISTHPDDDLTLELAIHNEISLFFKPLIDRIAKTFMEVKNE